MSQKPPAVLYHSSSILVELFDHYVKKPHNVICLHVQTYNSILGKIWQFYYNNALLSSPQVGKFIFFILDFFFVCYGSSILNSNYVFAAETQVMDSLWKSWKESLSTLIPLPWTLSLPFSMPIYRFVCSRLTSSYCCCSWYLFNHAYQHYPLSHYSKSKLFTVKVSWILQSCITPYIKCFCVNTIFLSGLIKQKAHLIVLFGFAFWLLTKQQVSLTPCSHESNCLSVILLLHFY